MVIELGQRFTFRNANATLGTGVITQILPNLHEHERLALNDGRKGIQKYDTKIKEKAAKEAAKAAAEAEAKAQAGKM
jgi:hypothetical protein